MSVEQTPKIYSAKLTPQQNAGLARYESLSGFEPIGIEEFEAGEITAYQLWRKNVIWLENVLDEVINTPFPVAVEELVKEPEFG